MGWLDSDTITGVVVTTGPRFLLVELSMVRCGVRCSIEGRGWRFVAALLVVVGFLFGISSSVVAQDDFFKPVVEATPTRKLEGPGPIFSFARLEPQFRAICRGLEEDGRRQRIVALAEAGVAREKVCITCRSFWKMIVSACGKIGSRPTPTPRPTKTPRSKERNQESPEAGTEETPTGQDLDVVVTPTMVASLTGKVGRPQIRYPSTEVLDEASRVSVSVYELDSGEGQTAEMLRYFAQTIRETPGLSAAEREYYDIFLTYLLAAWAGRVDSTKLPNPTPAVDLDEFF